MMPQNVSPAPTHPTHDAPVKIVMATRNGGRFIGEQLASLLHQTHRNWSLHVGDDGSEDNTLQQVRAFAAAHRHRHDITISQGDTAGCCANFLRHAAQSWSPGEWLVFCDQDDVWLSHKLSRAIAMLGDGHAVAAYASRSIVTDRCLRPLGGSPRLNRPASLANALVQNVLSGHTIMLTPAAADLVTSQIDGALAADVPWHDWWIYQLITGSGGRVVFDEEPGLLYRQHENNLLGARRGIRANLGRLMSLHDGVYGHWIRRNLRALERSSSVLTPASRTLIEGFCACMGSAGATQRVALLRDLGVYRQRSFDTFSIALTAWFGRL